MKRQPPEPARLLDLRLEDDPANLARLVRSAIKAPKEPVPSLKGRIRSTLRRRSSWRRRCLRASVIGGVIFLAGGVVGAVVQPIMRMRQQRRVESVENIYPSSAASGARGRRAVVPPPGAANQPPLSDAPSAALPSPLSPPALAPSPQGAASFEQPPHASSMPSRQASIAVATRPVRGAAPPWPASVSKPLGPASTAPTIPPTAQSQRRRLLRDSPERHPFQEAMLEPPPTRPEPPSWHISPPTAPPMPIPVASPLGSSMPTPPLGTASAVQEAAAGGKGPRFAVAGTAAQAGPVPVTPRPAAAPPPSEQVLLARAIRSLRTARQPESALALLDEYLARFPRGSLLPEATRLRTEALLELGQKPAALAELSREPAGGMPGSEDERLVRGELRAAAGRWQEALADFDAVVRTRLAHGPAVAAPISAKLRDRSERALWGRASARSHLGDDAGARTDLQEYLRRFPRGRFAAQAAGLLGEHR
jgi:hypothetical protein